MRALAIISIPVIFGLAAAGITTDKPREVPPRESIRLADAKATPAADAGNDRVNVAALGQLEPKGGVISIGATAGMRLGQLMVVQGQEVSAGDVLAHLDVHALYTAEFEAARIRRDEAKSRLAAERAAAKTAIVEADVGVERAKLQTLELEAQQARLGMLTAQADVAQKDQQRLDGLTPDVVSPQERDHQALVVRQALDNLTAAKAEVEKLKAGQDLSARAAAAALDSAHANLDRVEASAGLASLEQQVKLAEVRVEQAIVRAPSAGQVLRIIMHPGEMIGQQPILQLGNVRQMQVVAEVYETDIGLVKIGQRATIRSRALPRALSGVVEQIGVMVAANQVLSIDPAARADTRVVSVWIHLDDSEAAARLVNLQVDVEIRLANPAAPAPRKAS